jgi:uncharacterized protein (DUF2236 family)
LPQPDCHNRHDDRGARTRKSVPSCRKAIAGTLQEMTFYNGNNPKICAWLAEHFIRSVMEL